MPRKPKRRTWGTGSVTERDGRWWIRWRENGRRRCKSFASQEVAEQALAKNIRDAERGAVGLPRDKQDAPKLKTLVTSWLERRKQTARSWRNDVCRWNLHLAPVYGRMQPHEVNAANLRRLIESKLAEGLSPTTVGHLLRLISTIFTDLCEQGYVETNPVSTLTKATRRLCRSRYDHLKTPFIARQEDIERLYRALEEPYATIFAIGCMCGLRCAEIIGLHWEDVDMVARTINVRQQVQYGKLTITKSGKARLVPISTSLQPVLAAWRLASGGQGQLFKGINWREGRPPKFVNLHTVHDHLKAALVKCGLPPMTLYQCTRHTYASRFIMGGGSMEHLAKILGHSSVAISKHYAHMQDGFFGEGAHDRVVATFTRDGGKVLPIRAEAGTNGREMGTAQDANAETKQA